MLATSAEILFQSIFAPIFDVGNKFIHSTKPLRNVTSRLTALCVLFFYIIHLVKLGYWTLFLTVGVLLFCIYCLWFLDLIHWNFEHVYPLIWCWSPSAIFLVHSSQVLCYIQDFHFERHIITEAKIYCLHIINLFHLILPLVYAKNCNSCTFPYYVIGIFWYFFPDETITFGPWFTSCVILFDTAHHYASHHVEQFTLNYFTSLLMPFLVCYWVLSGTYSFVSELCGIVISLFLFLHPLRTILELLIDPESVIGLQLCFILGQVCYTAIVKLYYPESNIYGAVLRGLITGRILLMYSIQDERSRKKALGKSKLL